MCSNDGWLLLLCWKLGCKQETCSFSHTVSLGEEDLQFVLIWERLVRVLPSVCSIGAVAWEELMGGEKDRNKQSGRKKVGCFCFETLWNCNGRMKKKRLLLVWTGSDWVGKKKEGEEWKRGGKEEEIRKKYISAVLQWK